MRARGQEGDSRGGGGWGVEWVDDLIDVFYSSNYMCVFVCVLCHHFLDSGIWSQASLVVFGKTRMNCHTKASIGFQGPFYSDRILKNIYFQIAR